MEYVYGTSVIGGVERENLKIVGGPALAHVASAEGTAGATTAAAFLSRFVAPQINWLHLDLSASYQKSGNDLWAAGAKGHGVRTIASWLHHVTA